MESHYQATKFQTPLATCWLEPHTLCIVSNNVPRTFGNVKEHYRILKSIVRKKMCWLLDFQTCQSYDKEVRGIIDNELPGICSAISIIAMSSCEKMQASTFFKFQKLGIPVGVFETEKEARMWLKQIHSQLRKGESLINASEKS
jgi:hypothetical protein